MKKLETGRRVAFNNKPSILKVPSYILQQVKSVGITHPEDSFYFDSRVWKAPGLQDYYQCEIDMFRTGLVLDISAFNFNAEVLLAIKQSGYYFNDYFCEVKRSGRTDNVFRHAKAIVFRSKNEDIFNLISTLLNSPNFLLTFARIEARGFDSVGMYDYAESYQEIHPHPNGH